RAENRVRDSSWKTGPGPGWDAGLRFRFAPGGGLGQSPEMQKVEYLAVQLLKGGRVIEHMIGPNDLFRQGQLGLFAGGHLLFRPATLLRHTPQARGSRGIDVNETSTNVIPPRLQHDRRVENDQRHMRVLAGFLDLGTDAPAYPRVRDGLQRLQLGRVGENDGGQVATVDFALLVKHTVPAGGHASANVGVPHRR